MYNMLFTLIMILAFSQAIDARDYSSSYEYHYVVNPQYELFWNLTDTEIHFQIVVQTIAWVGLGIHKLGDKNNAMDNADIYTSIWYPNNGTFVVVDRFSQHFEMPPSDMFYLNCTDNVLPGSINGFQAHNVSVTQFARKLDTGDEKCDFIIQPGAGKTKVMWSHGIKNLFGFHGMNAGQIMLDFGDPSHRLTVEENEIF